MAPVYLEEISAAVLRCYLGYSRARSVVFGTAIGGTFREKIDALCNAVGEGGCFEALDPGPVNANDDRLDSVAWIPFSDMRGGKLIDLLSVQDRIQLEGTYDTASARCVHQAMDEASHLPQGSGSRILRIRVHLSDPLGGASQLRGYFV
jgi:hypothetical protein